MNEKVHLLSVISERIYKESFVLFPELWIKEYHGKSDPAEKAQDFGSSRAKLESTNSIMATFRNSQILLLL